MTDRPGHPSFEPPAGTDPLQPTEQLPSGQPALGQHAPFAEQQPFAQPQPFAQQFEQTWAPPTGQQPGAVTTAPKKRGGAGKLVALVLASSLLGGGVGSAVTLGTVDRTPVITQSGITTPVVQSNGGAVDWAAVAKAVEPAVVSISVVTGTSSSEGSGVILDAKGNIATNNHVVSGGQNGQINVTLYDNTIHRATIVGTDPGTDLAVIRLEDPPAKLTSMTFGDVSTLAVGDPVMAIGNPLGLSGSVTTGIVSALHRPVRSTAGQQEQSPFDPGRNQTSADTTVVTDAIQTSAPINPGNSGGALVNAQGQLVGLTSSIATVSGSGNGQSGNIGIGFAIRADQVQSVTESLIETGKAVTPFLGVSTADGVGDVNGQSVVGAKIDEITSGSPAEKAGLKAGDVITAMDGVPITGSISLAARVRSERVGGEVTLDVSRGTAAQQVKVTLGGR